jgi:hypothetical protein
MRQHTSACVSIRTFRVEVEEEEDDVVKFEVEDRHSEKEVEKILRIMEHVCKSVALTDPSGVSICTFVPVKQVN